LGLCLGTWKVVIKKREGKEESRARRLCSKSVLNLVLNQGVVVIVIVGSYYSSSSCWVPLIISPSSSSLPSPPRLPPSSYRFPFPPSHISPSPSSLSCFPLLPPRRVVPPTSSLLYRAPFCRWALPSSGPSVIHQRWAVGRFGWSWSFASRFATVASCLPPLSRRDSLCGRRVAFVVVVGFCPSSLS